MVVLSQNVVGTGLDRRWTVIQRLSEDKYRYTVSQYRRLWSFRWPEIATMTRFAIPNSNHSVMKVSSGNDFRYIGEINVLRCWSRSSVLAKLFMHRAGDSQTKLRRHASTSTMWILKEACSTWDLRTFAAKTSNVQNFFKLQQEWDIVEHIRKTKNKLGVTAPTFAARLNRKWPNLVIFAVLGVATRRRKHVSSFKNHEILNFLGKRWVQL